MVFRRFRLQVIFRVLLLTATISVFAWCLAQGSYLRSIYLACMAVVVVIEFVWYVDRFNRDIKTFLISLQQRDFATHFQYTGKGKSFDELYRVLNEITEAFRKISTEREIQFRYLEMLVEHVSVGILSIDREEKIHLANQAVKDLLKRKVLMSLKSLDHLDPVLSNTVRAIVSGETKLIKVQVEDSLMQLAIHAAEIKLDDQYYKLISMQNIRSELDAREMEAWQSLIRVLSHEIMNSVSPIISLSGTLHDMVSARKEAGEGGKSNESLDKGLEAIKVRSEGLFDFTQNYRKLVGIPALNLQPTNVRQLIERVKLLMQPRMAEKKINFNVYSSDVEMLIDPGLMEQVLINLLLNAIEAVAKTEHPGIRLWTTGVAGDKIGIHISDNGMGMDEATVEKVFIPFFTTKKNGTGIGLAVTRQILQMHKADIKVKTKIGEGTEFMIVI